jgi:PAS domain S-box-containing protein
VGEVRAAAGRRATERFALITDATAELLATDHPDAVVQPLCDRVAGLLGCDLFLNYLIDNSDPAGPRLRLNAAGGLTEADRLACEWLGVGVAVCGAVAGSGCPQMLSDVTERADPETEFIRGLGVRSYASFPIVARGRTLGALSFGSRAHRAFAADDAALIKAVADQIAIALQRVEQERAADAAAQRFQRLVEVSSQITWVTGPDGRPTEDSPTWRAFTGRSHAQWVGDHWLDVIHPEDRDRVAAAWRRAVDTRGPYAVEFRMLHHTGDYRHMACQAAPVLNADGSVREWVGMNTDVTDRKLAEDARRSSEERFRRLFDTSLMGVLFWDRSGVVHDANDEYLRLVGHTRDDLLAGRVDWMRITPPEFLPVDEAHLSAIWRGERPPPYEKQYVRADGTRVWVMLGGAVLHGDTGVAFCLDITAKKEAEQRLRASEERLRASDERFRVALRGKGTIAFEQDRELRHTWVYNPHPGFSEQQLLGRTDLDILPRETAERLTAFKRGALESGAPARTEMDMEIGGGWFTYDIAVEPLRDADGRVAGLIGSATDVTAVRRAERQLREATQRLQGHLRNSPLAVVEFDTELRVIRWTEAAERIFGWSADEVVGRRLWDIPWVHEDDRAQVVAVSAQMLAGVHRNVSPNRNLRKDGSVIHCEWYNSALHDDRGELVSILSLVLDVSERARAEAAVKESEARLRLGLTAGRTGLWDWDIRRDKVVWSEQLFDLHGMAPGEFGGTVEAFAKLIHPGDEARVNAALQATLRDGAPYQIDFRIVRPDGAVRWLSTTGQVIFDNGQPARMLGATADITDRKLAEAAVRESEARFRAFVTASNDAIYRMSADWSEMRMLQGNAFFADTDAPTTSWMERYIPADDRATVRAAIDAAIGGRRMFELEHRVLRADGSTGWTLSRAVPVLGPDGAIAEWFGAARDVTDRKRAEEAMLRAKQDAEQASRAKDHFLAVLSHELRTPLTPVLASAQMLEHDERLAGAHRELARVIRRNAELEARLIDDLLDLTRIARNKLELHPTTVNLHEKLRHVLAMCAGEIAAKSLNVETDFAATARWVRADPARLQQILWNLAKNAVKFTPEAGTVTVRTRDDARGQGDRVEIEITDSGIGIAADVLPRIFDAFEQGGRDVTRQFGGLGLGLAISRALVEMHGGEIAARSEGPGRGAAFVVTLPASAVAPAESPAGQRRGGPTLDCSILLVEDHPDTRRILARLLTDMGATVVTADCVAAALRLAATRPFDLLVSDIGLPDGSGVELMRQVRARHQLRGIALSGYGTEEDLARSREAGFEAHLTKPVNLSVLEQTLRRLVR